MHSNKMNKQINSLIAGLIAIGVVGCATTITPTDATLELIKSLTYSVSSQSITYDLARNPDHRPAITVTSAALSAMISTDVYRPELLASAMRGLPILSGSEGALIDLGAVIYSVAVGFIPIDSAPRLKAVVIGLDNGLKAALAVPASKLVEVRANPIKPCNVPNR